MRVCAGPLLALSVFFEESQGLLRFGQVKYLLDGHFAFSNPGIKPSICTFFTLLDDPGEAAEVILFANYLLRIVDRRAASLNRNNQACKPEPAHE